MLIKKLFNLKVLLFASLLIVILGTGFSEASVPLEVTNTIIKESRVRYFSYENDPPSVMYSFPSDMTIRAVTITLIDGRSSSYKYNYQVCSNEGVIATTSSALGQGESETLTFPEATNVYITARRSSGGSYSYDITNKFDYTAVYNIPGIDDLDSIAVNVSNAKTAAEESKNSADNAASRALTIINRLDNNTYGLNAIKSKVNNTYSKANVATTNTFDIAEGKTVAIIAKEARNKASSVESKVDNLQADISNLKTDINNMNVSDTTPPTVEIETVSGARATSGSEIDVYINANDNKPGPYEYRYSIDSYSSPWRTLPSNGEVVFGYISTGINKFNVKVKDAAGNIGTDSITIRGL